MPTTRFFHALAYYASLAAFGTCALFVNALAALSALAPPRVCPRRRAFFQRLIHRQSDQFLRWLNWLGLVHVEFRGWNRTRTERVVLVANHPGLFDACLLFARVPRGCCIFKPAIGRNPLLGAAARSAGFLASDHPLHLVRRATECLRDGATLIVFPEGTRTPPGKTAAPFRPGFALVARRARVPIQLVRISCATDLLGKGQPLWKLPQLPARIVVETGPALDPADHFSTAALATAAETWFHATPGHTSPQPAELTAILQPTLTAS